MNLNQLAMVNIAPRGIRGTCVPTSLCFVTGSSYYDVEEVLTREQPRTYRPDIKGNRGVDSLKLLGQSRNLFGFKFTKINFAGRIGHRLYSLRDSLTVGTYVVTVPHHMLVLKDGQIYDLSNTSLNAVILNVWKVEKA